MRLALEQVAAGAGGARADGVLLSRTFYARCEFTTELLRYSRDRWPMVAEAIIGMHTALEEAVEAHYEPNACTICGDRGVPKSALRFGNERVIFCPRCYPELMSRPSMVAAMERTDAPAQEA